MSTSFRERSRSPFHHRRSRSSSMSVPCTMSDGAAAHLGGWRPTTPAQLSPSSRSEEYYYNPNAYDHDLYRTYYNAEDDYYGAYGDLLEYEENLRLAADLSEAERLRRWQERLRFEELNEAERIRRYELMAEEERLRLGLMGSSWWARRYGSGRSHLSGSLNRVGMWKDYYANRLRRWSSKRLPLSNSLNSRFERIWYNPNSISRRRLSASVGLNAKVELLTQEQFRLTEELRIIKEEARLKEYEIEQNLRRINEEIIIERERAENLYRLERAEHEQREREIRERNRLEQNLYLHRLREYEAEKARIDLQRSRLESEHIRQELASSLDSQERELRLRRELEMAGRHF
ncbi:hypothetical protein O181_008529 [Austropuccinia psidii MF-1]|uniref:Uncharacterized protein n=1 Tax=Austropuccinia psidii MF-1 TaxID=1389203 RepID=A0A9Q3BP17_9BASI|nr:hypothetical protein [Austropuccinia psidii MF-1]